MPVHGDYKRDPIEERTRVDAGRPGSTSAPRWVLYGRGTALVFELTGTIGAGALLGYALDMKLGTEPWLMIVLTLAGFVGGFVRLVQAVKRLERGRD